MDLQSTSSPKTLVIHRRDAANIKSRALSWRACTCKATHLNPHSPPSSNWVREANRFCEEIPRLTFEVEKNFQKPYAPQKIPGPTTTPLGRPLLSPST